jgi:hypothetical protein
MVSTLSRVFQSIGTPRRGVDRHIPMLNELSTSLSNYYSSYGQLSRKKTLMHWYKHIPELTALANKVARDMTLEYHFEPVKGIGTTRVKQANEFALKTNYRRIKFARIIDRLITGEDFAWIGKITKDKLKKHVNTFLEQYPYLETKEKKSLRLYLESKAMSLLNKQTDDLSSTDGIDEALRTPRLLRYVPSTTMEVIHDQYDILNYRQIVEMKPVEFSPEEIIHGTFMDIDGKINGFSPVESVIVQLELLRFMWQNMLSIEMNGGSPDKIITLEDMKDVNSPSYKRIEQQLKKYKLVENKHGNMLFTGKVNVTELQQLDQMQFKDLGLYITGVIAMQWGIPRSSIPYIVGDTNTKDDTGGNSERGYWDNIEYSQKIDADIDNSQLWIPYFGVKLVYDKTYVQKDVQAETARQLKFNNVKLTNDLLMASGKQLSDESLIKQLGLNKEDITEAKQMNQVDSTLNQQIPRSDMNSESQQNISKRKRDEQNSTIASRGLAPTGVGKEDNHWESYYYNEK